MRQLTCIALAIALGSMAACDSASPPTDADSSTAPAELSASHGDRAIAFPPGADPYDRSMVQWEMAWWRWELSIPASVNPSLDATGANCVEGQSGKVWFLASTFGSGSVHRACTVPAGKALLVNLSSLLNDYPCPDPNFQPAPGQSLEEFLTIGARQVEDGVISLTLSVDGEAVADPFAYRVGTPLFTFTGHPSLTAVIDGCITGTPQPAVADGFFVMVKPLRPGSHTVAFSGASANVQSQVTYHLTVLPRNGYDDD